jgi:predicted RNase H-like HicB family nuclease
LYYKENFTEKEGEFVAITNDDIKKTGLTIEQLKAYAFDTGQNLEEVIAFFKSEEGKKILKNMNKYMGNFFKDIPLDEFCKTYAFTDSYSKKLDKIIKRVKSEYVFPAIYYMEEDKYIAEFPDISEAYTFSDSLDKLWKDCKEVLILSLECRLADEEIIPEPTKYEDLDLQEGQNVKFIAVVV